MEIKDSNNTSSDETKTVKQLEIAHLEQIKKDTTGKELVLFLSLAGSGKSTCISYLLGGKFDQIADLGELFAVLSEEQDSLASQRRFPDIRHRVFEPCTLTHQIFDSPTQQLSYCDTVGFAGLRQAAGVQNHAAISLQLIVEYAKNIKAVVVVIDWATLQSARYNELEHLMYILSQSLIHPEHFSDNILFLINKTPIHIQKDSLTVVVGRYKAVLEKDIHTFATKQMQAAVQRLREVEKILKILECQIQQQPQNIVFIDVFDEGESRQAVHAVIKEKNTIIPKKNLDFSIYKHEQEILKADNIYCSFSHLQDNNNFPNQQTQILNLQPIKADTSLREELQLHTERDKNVLLIETPNTSNTPTDHSNYHPSTSSSKISSEKHASIENEEITPNSFIEVDITFQDNQTKPKQNNQLSSKNHNISYLLMIFLGISLSLFGVFLLGLSLGSVFEWDLAQLLIEYIFNDLTYSALYGAIFGSLSLIFAVITFSASPTFIHSDNINTEEDGITQKTNIFPEQPYNSNAHFLPLTQNFQNTSSSGPSFIAQQQPASNFNSDHKNDYK